MRLKVYTDGSCAPNPGRGGWGWVAFRGWDLEPDQGASGAVPVTPATNNIAETWAVLRALTELKPPPGTTHVDVYTDSRYVLLGLQRRATGGWATHRDLWGQVVAELAAAEARWGVPVEFWYVPGHTGDPGNELANTLANGGRCV